MISHEQSGLVVRLDAPLPGEISVGRGTALFVCGTCFHRDAEIRALSILVDGDAQPVAAFGMPRLDLFRSLHSELDPFVTADVTLDPGSDEDPHLNSYRSGFWGTVTVLPTSRATIELALRADLEDGSIVQQWLASPEVRQPMAEDVMVQQLTGARPDTDCSLVAICMATYEPPLALFRRQIDSIRGQTHGNWVCVISDDRSSATSFAAMRDELAEDSRFVLSRSPRRLGFYLNFERALTMAPTRARYVALADQDDDWFADKLAVLVEAIGDAQLVYSDARVIDSQQRLLSDTYWVTRRNNHADMLSLLMTNAVTGAASLFRRELLEYALPFPPPQFAHFHDHWIAVVALAMGQIEFVDRPLYDYVQHGDAALGHRAANWMPPLRSRLRSLRRNPRERVVLWRHHYFVDVCRLMTWATIVRLRCGDDMAPGKLDELERFLDLERSLPGLADLWRRGARELLGRRRETLGAEWMLAYAFTWRRLLSASVRARPTRRLRLDAVPPPALVVAPGSRPQDATPEVRAIADKIAPLSLEVSDRTPQRINVLIPTIDLDHFFAGYIAKFNLARRLAERGLRVRLVTVDPSSAVRLDWRRAVEGYAGLGGMFELVEVAFGREASGLEVSPHDHFIATTWWTAHIAQAALAELERDGFLYLIQEYEPFTFPMGTYAALAGQSYEFKHRALFSTEFLRDYFRTHALGVYAAGSRAGKSASASFQNAISPVAPPSADELASRRSRRLLFYARPEAHANRNMFELGLMALSRAAQMGAFEGGWELRGTGTVQGARTLRVGAGHELELIPRSDQAAYAQLLRDHDVGLALMYTPHPSLVPIEMAAAAMLAVTNTFENKTEQALKKISSNLIAPPPRVDAIADALCTAAGAVDEHEPRLRGSEVAWSRDWNGSFDEPTLRRVIELLGE